MTPDEDFVIDTHPQHPHVVISASCSGHAFKFSTLLGSVLTDLALRGATAHDIGMFRLGRFQPA
jgi:glycine/D-amino acid oxidase-like deaminating enzyme